MEPLKQDPDETVLCPEGQSRPDPRNRRFRIIKLEEQRFRMDKLEDRIAPKSYVSHDTSGHASIE
jgi:hypothetical protein